MYGIEPARYTCHRAAGPITVDGKLDEASWIAAPKSGPLVDIVTGAPAWYDTQVALLWDDENLYVGFWAQEPRVHATLTERDSRIYEDNDFEVSKLPRDPAPHGDEQNSGWLAFASIRSQNPALDTRATASQEGGVPLAARTLPTRSAVAHQVRGRTGQ